MVIITRIMYESRQRFATHKQIRAVEGRVEFQMKQKEDEREMGCDYKEMNAQKRKTGWYDKTNERVKGKQSAKADDGLRRST